jgi:ribosomal protein L37AE/L43A
MTKQQKQQAQAARDARLAYEREIVATGKCPDCGRPIRRNLALAGWWQCSQLGAVGFRADATQPSCDWQTFTE